ncbi:MAG: dihydrofolate reductase [Bacteroidota bacterium]|nr:dihydrofolate reductase [Bacteroidota bacterium]MDX5431146.1 dihydrofolate reductase [Bacteroidota bacterium]MDX5469893.1 dihydrofolate reductase [Bacteroidota bacterium]
MILSAIVAAAEDNAIGKDNDLLWSLPDDMRFFKTTTSGHAVIMGRKTLESFGRPLKNRTNICITRNPEYQAEGVICVGSIEAAIEEAKKVEAEECFLLGGGEIYRQGLQHCDKVYLTRVHARFPDAEAHFPELNAGDWKETYREEHATDERHAYAFTFLTYERIR